MSTQLSWDGVFEAIRPVTFGSLWWVPEQVWQTHIRKYTSENRRAHPGLALHQRWTSGMEQIPMAHGTTANAGAVSNQRMFLVKGLTRRDPERKTAFGHLLAPAVPPAAWQKEPRIQKNYDKPELSVAEKEEFEYFAKQRRWIP